MTFFNTQSFFLWTFFSLFFNRKYKIRHVKREETKERWRQQKQQNLIFDALCKIKKIKQTDFFYDPQLKEKKSRQADAALSAWLCNMHTKWDALKFLVFCMCFFLFWNFTWNYF